MILIRNTCPFVQLLSGRKLIPILLFIYSVFILNHDYVCQKILACCSPLQP